MTFYAVMFCYFAFRISCKFASQSGDRAEELAFASQFEKSRRESEDALHRFQQWRAEYRSRCSKTADPRLVALGIDRYPRTKQELKRARNAALQKFHVDKIGGDHDRSVAIIAAYESLLSDFDLCEAA